MSEHEVWALSIGGRKFGTKAISISCRVVSERTTFGTMKMAIELS